jgi:hypothetical protein
MLRTGSKLSFVQLVLRLTIIKIHTIYILKMILNDEENKNSTEQTNIYW